MQPLRRSGGSKWTRTRLGYDARIVDALFGVRGETPEDALRTAVVCMYLLLPSIILVKTCPAVLRSSVAVYTLRHSLI